MADKYDKMSEWELYNECLRVFGGVLVTSRSAEAMRENLRAGDPEACYKNMLGDDFRKVLQ